MKDKDSSDLKSLPKTIREYLKTVTDRHEKSLLKQFNEFIKATYGRVNVSEVDAMYFEEFLRSLSLSETTLKSNRSRLNRFKRHIGLSTAPSYGGRRSKKSETERLKRQLAKKDDVIARYQETIDEKGRKNQENIDTKDGEIEELRQKLAEKKSMKGLKPLETEKTQLEKEIAVLKVATEQMKNKLKDYPIRCPFDGELKSLGNDCLHCLKYASCPHSTQTPLTFEAEKEEGD